MKTDFVIFALFSVVVVVLGVMAGEYYLGYGDIPAMIGRAWNGFISS